MEVMVITKYTPQKAITLLAQALVMILFMQVPEVTGYLQVRPMMLFTPLKVTI
jgi:hypothetical protein